MNEEKTAGISRPVIGIHQPNYLPYAGFFSKMLHSDCFIYLDTAQFTKNGFQNRNRILTPRGVGWLTVPVRTRGRFGVPTCDVEIDSQSNWRRKHLGSLTQSYGKAPFFPEIYSEIEAIYSQPIQKLTDLNIRLLEICRRFLDIATPLRIASEMPGEGSATERIAGLVEAVGGKTYLSGSGGRKYLDTDLLVRRGIGLEYMAFQPRGYSGRTPETVSSLSVIDVLFHLGYGAARWLRGESYE